MTAKRKKKQSHRIGAKPLPYSGEAPDPGYLLHESKMASDRFERSCKQVFVGLIEFISNKDILKQIDQLAKKGLAEAAKREEDNRWPLFEQERPDASKDIPQAACILVIFLNVFSGGPGFDTNTLIKNEAIVKELRWLVEDYYYRNRSKKGEVNLFTKCSFDLKNYLKLQTESGVCEINQKDIKLTWQTKAIGLLLEHRDWSIEKIAKEVGRARKTLYHDRDVGIAIKARNKQKKAKSSLPDGEKENGNLEAWKKM